MNSKQWLNVFLLNFQFTLILKKNTHITIHLLLGLWWKRASATFEQLWQWSHLCRWVHLTAPCRVYSSHVLSPAHPLPLKDKIYRSIWVRLSFWIFKKRWRNQTAALREMVATHTTHHTPGSHSQGVEKIHWSGTLRGDTLQTEGAQENLKGEENIIK